MRLSSTLSTEVSGEFDPLVCARHIKAPITPPTRNKKKLQTVKHDTKRKLFLYERQKCEREMLLKELARLSRVLRQEETDKKMTAETKKKRDNFVWKTLVKQRLRERLDSEAQRKWLLAAISGKRALIDDLKSVVRQYILLADLNPTWNGHTGLFVEPSDDLLYTMELQDIDNLYQQTDSVFSTCGLDPALMETTAFQRTVTKDSEGVTIQLARRQHFLFSYEQTWQSVWMLSHMMHRQEDREDFSEIDDPENMTATKFRITRRLPGGSFQSLKERLVLRKFHGNNRTILVWKVSLTGEGSFTGMKTEETGWSIIRPSPTGSGSVMEVCIRQVPLHLKCHNAILNVEAARFSCFLQDIMQENSQEITNGSKTLLLDHMLTGIDA